MIKVNNLTIRYPEVIAVDDVSMQLEEGIIYGLVGPNGAGKSSLIKAMVGFYRADFRVLGPPLDLDLIMCRNMAYTYFGPDDRRQATITLAGALRPGGVLVVGLKENPDLSDCFDRIYPCVYRKTTNGKP